MSARREARARVDVALGAAGGLPAALAVGPVTEVWGVDVAEEDPHSVILISRTNRRYRAVRSWWMQGNGIDDAASWKLLPARRVWSAAFLIEQDRGDDVAERLARSGCTVQDLPRLRAQADKLLASAGAPGRPRGVRRV